MNADSTLTPDVPSRNTCDQIKRLARLVAHDIDNDQLDGNAGREWFDTVEGELYEQIFEAVRDAEVSSPARVVEERDNREARARNARDLLRRELTV